MKIRFNDLIELLAKHEELSTESVAPQYALYIDFREEPSEDEGWKDAISYETSGGGRFLIELDEDGKALGIEFY